MRQHFLSILFLFICLGLTSEVIQQQCLIVAVVLWPMCCHTGMPCHRHRTWHPTLSQYTGPHFTKLRQIVIVSVYLLSFSIDLRLCFVLRIFVKRGPDTGSTCRCVIHWCGTSHWNTQLPILISLVHPRPSTHTSEGSTLCCYGGSQSEAR